MKLTDDEFAAALEAFSRYAGMDDPYLPIDQWGNVQVRIVRWQVKNFGVVPAKMQTLGIGEEIGELAESVFGDLDYWSDDSFNNCPSFVEADITDAIADAMVYATQLATCWRLDAGTLWRVSDICNWTARTTSLVMLAMAATVGRLSRAALKSEQKIRGYDQRDKTRRIVADNIARLFFLARALGKQFGIDVWKGFVATAEQVMTRDWIAFPTNGRTS